MENTCALCWRSLDDEPRPLVRRCDDGSLLRCHRSHALTARINKFVEPDDSVMRSPFTRLAVGRSLPAKELGI